MTFVIGVVSSSAVTLGSAGYVAQFVDLPQGLIVVLVVVALGAVAAWGILESVLLASVFTLIEVGGLLAIIAAAVHVELPIASRSAAPAARGRHAIRYRFRQSSGLLCLCRI